MCIRDSNLRDDGVEFDPFGSIKRKDNNKPNDLQSNSSQVEDMEDDMVVIQTIIMNNNTSVIASASNSITSNTNTNSNSLKDYQMSVLGS